MAVKGSATVTLSQYRDTKSVTRYYKLQLSSLAEPDKPTNVKPDETPAGWSKSEPACDITMTLYTVDVTVFSDGTTYVSDVSKSTSYEAAKEAWNKASNAQGTANEAKTEIKEQKQFFYHDDEGAHVIDASDSKFRADLKSSGLYIVDLNSGKPSAIFGEKRCIIGGNSKAKNLQITEDSVRINNGTYPMVEIKTVEIAADEQSYREELVFDGNAAWETIGSGSMFEITYELLHAPTSILNVVLPGYFGEVDLPLEFNGPLYGYTIDGNKLHIYADGSAGETKSYYWEKYRKIIVNYIVSTSILGVVEADVINLTEELSFAKGGEITYFDENNNVCGLIGITRGDGKATANTGKVASQPRWWRCGNIVQMEFTVEAKGSVASGSNIATGKITGIPRPVTLNGIRGVSYYGDNANVSFVSQEGAFTVRNCGDDALAKGNNAIGIFTYITDGYML